MPSLIDAMFSLPSFNLHVEVGPSSIEHSKQMISKIDWINVPIYPESHCRFEFVIKNRNNGQPHSTSIK